MDLSFALRGRRAAAAPLPDLGALLSAAAARQAMTPTARAHWLHCTMADGLVDPRVALFSGITVPPGARSARFAEIATMAVNRRQS
jgi:hypothetical protein